MDRPVGETCRVVEVRSEDVVASGRVAVERDTARHGARNHGTASRSRAGRDGACRARGMDAGTAMTALPPGVPISLAGMVHDGPT